METHITLARRLKQAKRAVHISANKWLGVGDRIIVMRFRSKMNYSIYPRDNFFKQCFVADVAMDKCHAIFRYASQVLSIASVSEGVKHDHVRFWLILHYPMNKVAAYEPGTAGNKIVFHILPLYADA